METASASAKRKHAVDQQKPMKRSKKQNDDKNEETKTPDQLSVGPALERFQGKPRPYTVSIAVPGSIVANAQSPELRTYLAGQIARACTIFNVDEVSGIKLTPCFFNLAVRSGLVRQIIVFSENAAATKLEGEFHGAKKGSDPNAFLARILQYLETPQYVRRVDCDADRYVTSQRFVSV